MLFGISLMDWIGLVGMFTLPVFLVLDLVWRDRKDVTPHFWRGRAAIVTLVNLFLAGYVATFFASIFEGKSLLNGSGLGTIGGAVTGILVYELVHYWYHRLAHNWDFLWRSAHQMHHSAESLDAFGAYYLHPVDAALFTMWGSLVFFPLLGLSAEAGLIASVFVAFNGVFQHANIRTPRWLGYFIQRPESHRVHHGREVQQANYSDLPLWDFVFGTFQNPADGGPKLAGFYHGASSRIADMLIGKDVTAPMFKEKEQPVVSAA